MIQLAKFKKVLRELLIEVLTEKINSKDMPNGSSWTTAGKGWGAKNKYGVTNYWYGKDDIANKKNADDFAHHNDTKPATNSGLKKEEREPKQKYSSVGVNGITRWFNSAQTAANHKRKTAEIKARKAKEADARDDRQDARDAKAKIKKGSDSSRDDIR